MPGPETGGPPGGIHSELAGRSEIPPDLVAYRVQAGGFDGVGLAQADALDVFDGRGIAADVTEDGRGGVVAKRVFRIAGLVGVGTANLFHAQQGTAWLCCNATRAKWASA